MMSPHRFPLLLSLVIGFLPAAASAQAPRVLEKGTRPADKRLEDLKDLNGYFPFEPAESKSDWERRSASLRRQTTVALGLLPMPTRSSAEAVIHGKIEQDDYTIEKVYFESFPGFFVTGSLYRPKGEAAGKRPAVLCPHGHWANGRFHDAGEAAAKKQIDDGAERFIAGGRSPLQARCVQLARMGCVVFHYDMIGYADSQQISFELAHRFAKQRPEANSTENWGLFSPQAVAHGQSIMGLQAYGSVRALDFVSSLPDVDAERIAVTGASGGGTQTFILCAIDPRPAVSVPAVMVSTAMQGGCTCENCSLLRVGTGNVELAALFAPKPQMVTAADDWTKEMETKGFPDLQRHYALLGAEDKVALTSLTQFGHNYNHVSRSAMYNWMNRHLKLGLEEPVMERDFEFLTAEQLTVWDEEHPRPEGGLELEKKLLAEWHNDAREQIDEKRPQDEKSLREYREIVGTGIDAIIGRSLPPATSIEYEQTHKVDKGDYLEMAGLLRNTQRGEELPIAFLYPKDWSRHVVVWLDERGKNGLYDKEGSPIPPVAKLLASGVSVVGVDLLFQGEFLEDGKPIEETRRVENPREAAGYTFGYNDSLFSQRVHDVLTVIAFVRSHDYTPERVDLVAPAGAGHWAAAARAQARGAVDNAAIDTGGFRFGNLTDLRHPDFLPSGAKYDDLPGMLAVAAPAGLLLAGETETPPAVKAAYEASGGRFKTSKEGDAFAAAAVGWLLSTE